jgi:dienelactone hydrolase
MKPHVLATATFWLLLATAPAAAAGPWDVKALQAAEVKPAGASRSARPRGLLPRRAFGGKPTRVFAYYASRGAGPFPAVVLVHGGGGKAFPKWASTGRRAATAPGDGHRRPRPERQTRRRRPDQSDEAKFRDFDETSAKEMWSYHAVAAVIRGHNLLRGLPEVDKDRTAVTGISWGGYLTCIVAGPRRRF